MWLKILLLQNKSVVKKGEWGYRPGRGGAGSGKEEARPQAEPGRLAYVAVIVMYNGFLVK